MGAGIESFADAYPRRSPLFGAAENFQAGAGGGLGQALPKSPALSFGPGWFPLSLSLEVSMPLAAPQLFHCPAQIRKPQAVRPCRRQRSGFQQRAPLDYRPFPPIKCGVSRNSNRSRDHFRFQIVPIPDIIRSPFNAPRAVCRARISVAPPEFGEFLDFCLDHAGA